MADSKLETELPRWLRDVELEPGSGRQAAILAASQDLSTKVEGRAILDLVCLAHGSPDDTSFERLSEAVRAHDTTFGCRADDLELRLAASVAIAALLEQDSPSASIASQAVLSAQWLQRTCPIVDLPDLARSASERRSEDLRRRLSLPSSATKNFFKAAPKLNEEGQEGTPTTQQEVGPLRNAASSAALAIQNSQLELVEALEQRLDAVDEELAVLWWAFSGYSDLIDEPWSAVDDGTAAVLAGIELAENFRFEAELPSTKALLSRVLARDVSATTSLAEAVNGAAPHVKSLVDGHPLMPILSAIGEHAALEGDAGWKKSLARWQVKPTHKSELINLACQAARESSLARKL